MNLQSVEPQRLARLLFFSISLAFSTELPAQEVEVKTDGQTLPYSHARCYSQSSQKVWGEMLAVLKQHRIKTNKRDKKSQVAITKDVRFNKVKGIPLPNMTGGYEAHTFQLHLFVSPYVEPAHVHIGSVVEFRPQVKDRAIRASRITYNSGAAESWFFNELQSRLNEVGKPIPEDPEEERNLSARLLGEQYVDPCLERSLSLDHSDTLEPPKKVSDVAPRYPGIALHGWKEAQVALETIIRRDGSVGRMLLRDVTVIDKGGQASVLPAEAHESKFRYTAESAVSLWRYRPVHVEGCPVPIEMRVTVSFGFQ